MKRNVNTKLRSADAQTKRFGLGMLSPTVVILLIMTAYPLFFTLVYSFTGLQPSPQPEERVSFLSPFKTIQSC